MLLQSIRGFMEGGTTIGGFIRGAGMSKASLAIMAITAAAVVLIPIINKLIHHNDELIENGQKAMDSIAETYKKYKEAMSGEFESIWKFGAMCEWNTSRHLEKMSLKIKCKLSGVG